MLVVLYFVDQLDHQSSCSLCLLQVIFFFISYASETRYNARVDNTPPARSFYICLPLAYLWFPSIPLATGIDSLLFDRRTVHCRDSRWNLSPSFGGLPSNATHPTTFDPFFDSPACICIALRCLLAQPDSFDSGLNSGRAEGGPAPIGVASTLHSNFYIWAIEYVKKTCTEIKVRVLKPRRLSSNVVSIVGHAGGSCTLDSHSLPDAS